MIFVEKNREDQRAEHGKLHLVILEIFITGVFKVLFELNKQQIEELIRSQVEVS